MADPSFAEISRLLKYEPETGKLFWLPRTADMFADGNTSAEANCSLWNGNFAGKEAFTANNRGYRCGRVNYTRYQAHRVCWLLHYGEWPTRQIDHINGVRDDNRIENLREVTAAENAKNLSVPSSNTSGAIGVSWRKANGKWKAQIKVKRRDIHLGYFDQFEQAVAARRAAEIAYGFHANHGKNQDRSA